MLRALGYVDIQVFHMNEGHSALATLALLEEIGGERSERRLSETELQKVRQRCAFTTHTPVPAGHDRFQRIWYIKFWARGAPACWRSCSSSTARSI